MHSHIYRTPEPFRNEVYDMYNLSSFSFLFLNNLKSMNLAHIIEGHISLVKGRGAGTCALA